MISPEKIEEIKNAVDIVDLISEYLELKKTGSNMKGLCPFHQEKTPSFVVSPEKQIFNCFGCGAGGNVFSFLQKHEGMTFVESVRFLAGKAGIELNYAPADKSKFDEREKILAVNRDALKFFRRMLEKNTAAEEYVKQRGITPETAEIFKIGYAPRGNGLYGFLKEKGHKDDDIIRSWLCAKNERGAYDIFRNRLIFPILNVNGEPVAFGARVLDDSVPKYINTKETALYVKGRNVYNLYNARREKDGFVIITEGYMDTIALCSRGIKNTAASLGTAMTNDQAKLIKRFFEKAVIMYDSDAAGIAGAKRAGAICFENGIDCRVAVLDAAKDPDEYIEKFGVKRFKDEIKKALPFTEFFLEELKNAGDIKNPHYKEKAVKEAAGVIGKAPGLVIINDAVKKTAEIFRISEDVVRSYMKLKNGAVSDLPGAIDEYNRFSEKGRELAEKIILNITISSLNKDEGALVLRHIFSRRNLMEISYDDFKNPLYAEIIKKTETYFREKTGNILEKLQSEYIDNEKVSALIAAVLAAGEEKYRKKNIDEELMEAADDCFFRIKNEKTTASLSQLQQEITQAEKKGDFEELKKLILQKQILQKKTAQRGEVSE
ncbi:MAG: DNA primase [Candidatus Goldiibacteriota bacterium]